MQPTPEASSTQGNPIAGNLAATLGAAQLRKHVLGEGADIGHELVVDLAHNTAELTRLVRSADCRLAPAHCGAGRWDLEPVDDEPLRDLGACAAALLGDSDDIVLAFPGRVFAERADCVVCGMEDGWLLAFAHDATLEPCVRCGAARAVSGFARRERMALAKLPPALLERSPFELGLRAGDVLEFRAGSSGERTVHFELALGGVRVASSERGAALFGVGNIGAAMVPLLARTPGLERILVCDFDQYDPGQTRTQAIDAADVGRRKVDVARETIRRITPSLEVRTFATRLEDVPLGELRGSVIVSALDSVGARMRLAERAWRVGSLFIDAGVAGGESLLARTTVFAPSDEQACFECSLGDYSSVESVLPCQSQRTLTPPAA